MPSPTYLTVPLNVTNELELRRFLQAIINQLDTIISTNAITVADDIVATNLSVTTNTTDIATNTTDIATNTTDIATNTTDIATLIANLNNPSIASSALPAVTASAAYVQAESQTLANDIQNLQTSINSILNSLRLAKIIV